MNLSTLRTTLLALLVCSRAVVATAQIPGQQVANAAPPGFTISNLTISNSGVPACNDHFSYSVGNQDNPSTTTPAGWVSLKGGSGTQTFDLNFHLHYVCPGPQGWDYTVVYYAVYVDDTEKDYGALDLGYVNSSVLDRDLSFTVSHNAGENAYYAPGGKRRFEIRFMVGDDPYYPLGGWMENQNHQIAFDAVMVGAEYTSVIGYFNTPQVPLYILRDPPGDASYSTFSQATNTCSGQTVSVSTDQTASVWAKAKIGTEGSVGVAVETDYKIYGEGGLSSSASRSETGDREYVTCIDANTTWQTSATGEPDDLFIGSAVRYAYGAAKVISRDGCNVVREARFAMTPKNVMSSYSLSESSIRNTTIPDLEQAISLLEENGQYGSAEYKRQVNQLNVWNQTLAMNDDIKASAANGTETAETFSGGGSAVDHSVTRTTTDSRSIEFNVSLEAGLSLEFCAEIGGSGVSAGGELKMRQEYGKGQSSTNTTTNTMAYHMEDADAGDAFTVDLKKDEVLGTYVFALDENVSATSCPYEGGYQIDQPSLSVGTPGVTQMVVNEATVGQPVTFPVYICNNSNLLRTYNIRVKSGTNTESGVLVVEGENISSDILGHECEDVPANGCYAVSNLTLTDPNPFDQTTDFVVEVYLYSPCDPDIRSTVILEAHFGEGNVGGYCEPTTVYGTQYAYFVDGVQIGAISNTGNSTGNGSGYSDFTSLSTPLSRNANASVTITGGQETWLMYYGAWIDYNKDGAFDATEKLGEFAATEPYASQSINFTVPSWAEVGATRLRVRGLVEGDGMDPCYAYYYEGETEDYTVVIDDNTPQDCLGVDNGPATPGTSCDDGYANTGNDMWTANCTCVGQVLDCEGVPGGLTYPGTECDDGDWNTASDVYDASCVCAGLQMDCDGVPGGTAFSGAPCDDGDPNSLNDAYNSACSCQGQYYDCAGVLGGSAWPGLPCDDGNSISVDDVYNDYCLCAGVLVNDCLGVLGGTAQPGTACDDQDPETAGDSYGADCICAGLLPDCNGTPGGPAVPGAPCNDWNPMTTDDALTMECACLGTLTVYDCIGELGGTAQPGTACDDGDVNTGNDVYNASCYCAGEYIDCLGVAGGPVGIGYPCDDGNPATGGDSYGWDCICAGQLLDCNNEPGGPALIGSACDDGNPDSNGDVYNSDCLCAGTVAMDCEGVPGGTAQPGTPCDDGNADTGDDVYGPMCDCTGTLIDCADVIGGPLLPGTPCDDNEACTTGDMFSNECVCAGTALPISPVIGDNSVDVGSTNTYYITPVPGAIAYSWSLPNGWSSDNTSSFVLVAQASEVAGPAELCVVAITGACVLPSCITVQVVGAQEVAGPSRSADQWFTVQPNPSNGLFQLIPAKDQGDMDVTVYDGTARLVKATFPVIGNRAVSLDLGEVAPGAYYLLATRGGEQRAMKLIVRR